MKFIYLSLFFICCSCLTTERNCANFKTGEFEYIYEVNGKTTTSTFTRNDTLEIDYHGKHVDSVAVRWINDCEYVLKTINPKTLAQQKAIHIKILSTKENTYTFESKIINDPQQRKTRGTVTKIK